MKFLSFLAVFGSLAIAQTSVSSNTTPMTTLPSTTMITSTASMSISGIGTSTAANGSLSISFSQTSAPIVPNPTSAPVVAGEYKLRIQTINGGPRRFYGQYLAAWSIAPNVSADAVFTSNKTQAARFYLNGTFEQVDLGTKGHLWQLNINPDLISSRWFTVGVRSPASAGFGAFYVNGTGLQWTPNQTPPPHTGVALLEDAYFGGWMACDWWHATPQLFYKVGFFSDTEAPAGCSDIVLVPEYFKK